MVAIVSTRSSTQMRQWLLIGAILGGLVAMHHLMALPMPAHMSTPAESAPAHVMAMDEGGAGASDACLDGCCMLGHPCQAVLSHTAEPVKDASSVATAVVPCGGPPTASPEVITLAARAPPDSGTRLSQLGVWRN